MVFQQRAGDCDTYPFASEYWCLSDRLNIAERIHQKRKRVVQDPSQAESSDLTPCPVRSPLPSVTFLAPLLHELMQRSRKGEEETIVWARGTSCSRELAPRFANSLLRVDDSGLLASTQKIPSVLESRASELSNGQPSSRGDSEARLPMGDATIIDLGEQGIRETMLPDSLQIRDHTGNGLGNVAFSTIGTYGTSNLSLPEINDVLGLIPGSLPPDAARDLSATSPSLDIQSTGQARPPLYVEDILRDDYDIFLDLSQDYEISGTDVGL